jgi:hypothetical protein
MDISYKNEKKRIVTAWVKMGELGRTVIKAFTVVGCRGPRCAGPYGSFVNEVRAPQGS